MITHKFIEISQLWIKLNGHCVTRRIHHQITDKCCCNTQYTSNCVGVRVDESNLIAGCISLITTSSIWNDVINHHAEWFIISIMIMHEYSPGHIHVCEKYPLNCS